MEQLEHLLGRPGVIALAVSRLLSYLVELDVLLVHDLFKKVIVVDR